MGQLAEVNQLSDRVGQLVVTQRVAAQMPVIIAIGTTFNGVDHLLEQVHHLHTAGETETLNLSE